MRRPSWLSLGSILSFLALEFVANATLSAVAWGVGVVVGFFLTRALEVPWYVAPIPFIGFGLVAAGITGLLLLRVIPSSWLEERRSPRADEQPEQVEDWESSVDVSNRNTMVISLRSKVGVQMIRGLACDVRGPRGGVPERATIDKQGPVQFEHVHYPESFAPTGAVPMDGRYEITWYEADEKWEWRRLVRATHDVSLPPAPPNVAVGIHMQYDSTVVVSIGVDNPRREAITDVSLNFVVPDSATEIVPVDQSGGRLPRSGSVLTTSESLSDDEGRQHGESKYWDETGFRFPGRTHTVMYFRVTFPGELQPFPVKVVFVSPDMDEPIIVSYTVRPQG